MNNKIVLIIKIVINNTRFNIVQTGQPQVTYLQSNHGKNAFQF